MDRHVLLKQLGIAKLALATKDFVPVLTCFHFTGKEVVAYNDQLGIKTKCPTGFSGLVRGSQLLGFLNKYTGKELDLTVDKEILTVGKGRSKFTAPILPESDYIFKVPSGIKNAWDIDITPSFILALRHCLISASDDMSMPQFSGILVRRLGDFLKLFSTNDRTICSYEIPGKKLEGGETHAILPTNFCTALVDIADEVLSLKNPEASLSIGKQSVMATFGGGTSIYSKFASGVNPPDYEAMVASFDAGHTNGDMVPIPANFYAAIQRCQLVLTEDSPHIIASIAENKLTLRAESRFGKVREVLKLEAVEDHTVAETTVRLLPEDMLRVSDKVSSMLLGQSGSRFGGTTHYFNYYVAPLATPTVAAVEEED